MNKLFFGDCVEILPTIPDHSVNMVLCDLPYGTLGRNWDTPIPLDFLWGEYGRIVIPGGAIVLTAREPFTSRLVMSNLVGYKHKWVWNKKQTGSPLNAKWMPLQIEEDILVFSVRGERVNYFPQMREGKWRVRGGNKGINRAMGDGQVVGYKTEGNLYHPTNIIEMANPRKNKLHPTQKPVELFEYLIKTYSKEGDVILDNTMGSGTTCVAAKNLRRQYIGIEVDETFYKIAEKRINDLLDL